MRKTRWWQCGGLFTAIFMMGAPMVGAQDAEQQEQVVGLETFRVIGSRVQGRSAQDSPVPVDIIRGEDLQTYGIRDMDSLLSASVPSYNVGQEPISDEATFVRPATLRGLPPDSTLVLVNGKRRHRGSVINFLGAPNSRGSQGADISTIPSIALEQIEVLRDGAAAQYGSDAIAGVLNFKLREDTEGLTVQTSYGQNYHGDGDKVNVAANLGVPLTENGFANFSFEFMNVDETSRSVQRDDARGLIEAGNEHVRRPAAQIWGAPEVQYDYKFFGNLGLDLEDLNSRLYAFGNYAERKVEGGFYFRNPHTRNGVFRGDPLEDGTPTVKMIDLSDDGRSGGCRDIPIRGNVPQFGEVSDNGPDCFSFIERFPGGFTPRFGGYVKDWSIAFGLTGNLEGLGGVYSLLNGWFYDVSAYFGENSVDYFMLNTINPQLADMRHAIPTEYRPGGVTQSEKTFNLDISKPFDVGIFYSLLNMAFGFEYHIEEYEVKLGGENSWSSDFDRFGPQGLGVGSNGFTGFGPSIVGEYQRNNYALYMDLEAEVIETVTLGVAGRYENFDAPIGETLNGKVSLRWQILEMLAVRGAVSSGFRAPTPGQANVNKITTSFQDGMLIDDATFPAYHPASAFFGAKPLTPEKSVNYSAGVVFNWDELEVTLDYYRIKMQDRIVRSSRFNVADELAGLGITRAEFDAVVGPNQISVLRFYTNDFDTTTQGVDVVATYPLESMVGLTQFTFVGNWNKTKVDSRTPAFISDKLVRQIEEGLPEFRFSLTADHNWGPWRFLSRLYYYDDFRDYPTDGSFGLNAGERFLVDMELSYTLLNLPFMEAATFAFGAENLFDQYPRRNPQATGAGLKYPETSPYGFNGGFYYLRAGFEF
jgi:iron complex outermembrane receptor protein